MIIVVMGV